MKKIIALTMALVIGLSGCKQSVDNIRSIQYEAWAQEADVMDYYTQAMSYKTVTKRTTEVQKVTYETSKVAEDTENSLVTAVNAIQAELAAEDWRPGFHVGSQTHQYIKYLLDDKVLTATGKRNIETALGYFFVDIEYNMAPQTEATFTDSSKFVGIGGAFTNDYKGTIELDSDYMAQANQRVLTYCQENGVLPGPLVMPDGHSSMVRKSFYDIGLYNKVAGTSQKQSSFMPPLRMVVAPAQATGNLSGYGLFPQGKFDMTDFGYDRTKLSGALTLRYVFKQNLSDPTKVEFKTVYCTGYTLGNMIPGQGQTFSQQAKDKVDTDKELVDADGEAVNEENLNHASEFEEKAKEDAKNLLMVPEFIQVEIEKLVERSDRALSNGDLQAMLSGDIYADVGIGYLSGLYNNNVYGRRHMSNVEGYLARTGNKYLIDVETTVQENPKGTEQIGQYKSKAYMVVEQTGLEFIIKDYVVYDFLMTVEPQINVDSSTMKQLASANLTGTIPDTAKAEIQELLGKLYYVSTDRDLDGMYSCFDSDTGIVSGHEYEYMNSTLRGWLTKQGISTPTTYHGQVSEFMGGSSEQAELVAEELITYEGKPTAQYMQTYYLVSHYGNEWVIDNMKAIDLQDISAEEAQNVLNRMTPLTWSGSTAEGEEPKKQETGPKEFGALALMDVVYASSMDGGIIQSGPETSTEPVVTPEPSPGTGDSGAGQPGEIQTTGGEYVWDDRLQDYVWVAG